MNILVIGDICLDRYIIGEVIRQNPEAPAPLLTKREVKELFGMTANVARNLEALGANVELRVPAEVSIKERFVDRRTGTQLLRVDHDEVSTPLFRDAKPVHLEYDAIVVCDYMKGAVTSELIAYFDKHANCPVFLDTKKKELPFLEHTFVKLNAIETDAIRTPRPLHLITTRGAEGAEYFGCHYSAPRVQLADPCGAGDTFIAALAVHYVKYQNMPLAIPFANKAASITVQHMGVYAPKPEEIW